MKLVRFGPRGAERPGILDEHGDIRDATSLVRDWNGQNLAPERLASIDRATVARMDRVDGATRLGCPVADVGKIVAIGLNYADHAAEAALAVPDEPLFFLKATSAINGPHDAVIRPKGAEKLDWEVELAFVIGRRASYVDPARAADCIAGYTILNDISERAFQLERGSQWTRGKSCDSFAPVGPWLVTADEVGNGSGLDIELRVNGALQQASNTSQLIFDCATLVSSLSRYMTLEPGDIVSTGTPSGVGFAQRPQRFLRDGDVMSLRISGLGEQRQHVAAGGSD